MKDFRILAEWLDAKGNKIKLNNTTLNNTTQNTIARPYAAEAEKFKKLVDQINSEKQHTVYYNEGDIKLHIRLRPGSCIPYFYVSIRYEYTHNEYTVMIDYNSYNSKGEAYATGTHFEDCDTWDDVLDLLIAKGFIKSKNLCEAFALHSTAAEEFAFYENLWEGL